MNLDKIRKTILNRAYRLDFGQVYRILEGKPFILAGGALGKSSPNDFDIYPVHANPFDKNSVLNRIAVLAEPAVTLLSNTKNAVTVKIGEQTIQFCCYLKKNLSSLIKSFDFAHCQVGVLFGGNGEIPHDDGIEFTDDYLTAMVCENTFYTGSEYPTASLIRTIKYVSRGKFCGKDYVSSIIDILKDIVNRGFMGYDDFKDQMDAIDLGLSEFAKTRELFDVVKSKGLCNDGK